MSDRQCSRAWQAEAREDGRLSQQDAASFERHAASCDVCTREVEALARLRAVAQRLPVLTSTPLEHRRLRQEVLGHAHRASTRAPRMPKLAWLAAGTLALTAAGAALLFFARAPVALPAVPYVPSPPAYEANASPDAIWHAVQDGNIARVVFQRGQLELTVAPLESDARFIVRLPDGELEVKGTRFVMQADGVRTTSVRVIEGRVALRLRDQPESLLSAGDAFVAEDAQPKQPEAKVDRESHKQARTNTEIRKDPPTRVERKAMATAERTTDVEAPPPTESTFARAMTAFEAGDFGRADTLFAQFEREHPRDARIEDALFLRALSRARRGDAAGARELARDYLDRFPNGLRKPDAERLSR